MPFKFIQDAIQDLNAKGYSVEHVDIDFVRVVSPNGYESTMRLKRLPSLARYCR